MTYVDPLAYHPARHRVDSSDEGLQDLSDLVMQLEHLAARLYEQVDSDGTSDQALRVLAVRKNLVALSRKVADLAEAVFQRQLRAHLAIPVSTRALHRANRKESGSPLVRRR